MTFETYLPHAYTSHRDAPDCGMISCYWHGASRRERIALRNERGHRQQDHEVRGDGVLSYCLDCHRWASERPLCQRCGEVLEPADMVGFYSCDCTAGKGGME